MFRFAKSSFTKPNFRRAAQLSTAVFTGVALTSSVAFAKLPSQTDTDPLKVDASDITTAVPKLTPRDLTGTRPVDIEEPQQERRAYDPETGEIDWDCPCLGGMAHGPCGEEFKAAFACFVYSKEEIKGSECIPKFSAMQDCFRKYPEVYADFQGDEETSVKSEAKEIAEDAKEKVQDAKQLAESKTQDAKQLASQAKDTATSAVAAATDAVRVTASDLGKATEGAVEVSKETAVDAKSAIKDAAQQTEKYATEAYNQATPVAEKAADAVTEKIAELKTQGSELLETTENFVSDAKERAEEAKKQAANYVDQASEQTKSGIETVQKEGSDLAAQAQAALVKTEEVVSDAIAGVTAEAKDVVKSVEDKFK